MNQFFKSSKLALLQIVLLAACGSGDKKGSDAGPTDDAGVESCTGTEVQEEACGEGTRTRQCENEIFGEWGPCSDANENFIHVSNQGDISCAVRGDGKALCWLENSLRESPDDEFVSVSAGLNAACGMRADGTLRCWGYLTDSENWRDFGAPTGSFKSVEVRREGQRRLACGIKSDDNISCWDDNGTEIGGPLAAPAGTFQDLSLSRTGACAATTAGTLQCWGDHEDFPTVPALEATRVAYMSPTGCVLDAAGIATCFHVNLGNSPRTWSPSSVAYTDIDRVYAISYNPFCGLTAAGEVQCWDEVGLLEPPVAGPMSQLSGSCGLTDTGLMRCWYPSPLCATSTPGIEGINACGFCGPLHFDKQEACTCGGTFDCSATTLACEDGNESPDTATQLAATDDSVDEFQTTTAMLNVHGVDWYQVPVSDGALGIMDPEFKLDVPDGQSAQLCAYYFEEDEGTTSNCDFAPSFQFMGQTACGYCENIDGGVEETIFINPSLIGDASGWAFMAVFYRGGADSCANYTLSYRF